MQKLEMRCSGQEGLVNPVRNRHAFVDAEVWPLVASRWFGERNR